MTQLFNETQRRNKEAYSAQKDLEEADREIVRGDTTSVTLEKRDASMELVRRFQKDFGTDPWWSGPVSVR